MPFTPKQERLLHTRGIKHSHDYKPLYLILGTKKYVISKYKKNTKIVTKLNKPKRRIKIGKITYILS